MLIFPITTFINSNVHSFNELLFIIYFVYRMETDIIFLGRKIAMKG